LASALEELLARVAALPDDERDGLVEGRDMVGELQAG
jgi:hypothetical protein